MAHADRPPVGDLARHGVGHDDVVAGLDLVALGGRPHALPALTLTPQGGYIGGMLRTRFLGTGLAVPDRVVTNDELSRMMDTSDEWIRTRTGIQERRYVREGETGAELAIAASRAALEMAGLASGELDAIIYATSTP